ncbi:MAG: universal stress protein [Actinomycetales bacterium]|nr:universal stress protein [Actinomycetales bacterium]
MVNQVIVVGLDGSERSHDALRFALEEARLRDATVEVITTWREDSQGDTREQAEEIQAQVRAQVPTDGEGAPPVDFQVVHGRPQEVLVNASDRAALLVIGAHGVQSIRRAALGSISEYVARLANCPVVVIPAGAAQGATPGE